METVGLVGAGLMGTACARRLLQAGFGVLAYDVDEAKHIAIGKLGAQVADSIADVAKRCATIVLAVFNTDQVEQVIEEKGGILDAMGNGSLPRTLICTSTCDPDRLAALAARVAPRSAHILEAPISGTSRQIGR